MTRREIDKMVRIYYSNREFIEKYKNVSQREVDVNFRKRENKKFEELYPGIDNGDAMRKINE